ncbi:MAG: hypothetical protein CMB57_07245, partial [Euryarchaeota archaeon]|nr:hypothetical protein [Euryarchaeota archaeon]
NIMEYEYKVVHSGSFWRNGVLQTRSVAEIIHDFAKQGWRFVQTISDGGGTIALVFEKESH